MSTRGGHGSHCRPAVLIFLLYTMAAHAQHLRGIRDSVGFCWDGQQMTRFIHFLDSAERIVTPLPSPLAAISPHDDYLYAGRVYHPLFAALRAKEVVILGVTHGTVRRAIGDPKNVLILDTHKWWTGPNGPVECSRLRDLLIRKMDPRLLHIDDRAHRLEHSIEAVVPFLQHYNRDVRITPIMVTAAPFDSMNIIASRLASVIADYISSNRLRPGIDIALLASSDANHYGRDFGNAPWGEDETAHEKATGEDLRIVEECIAGRIDTARVRDLASRLPGAMWCGRYSVPFLMLTVHHLCESLHIGASVGSLFRYSDTFTERVLPVQGTSMGTTAPFSLQHWVGFLSAGFSMP